MTQSSIIIDITDPRASRVAEILSNKTAKKILVLLSDSEMSETDISRKSGIVANTVNYNVKKLVAAGLVEKSKKLMWSVKGRKIELYKVSNKRILISPKALSKGIIPAALISLGVALLIRIFVAPVTIESGQVSSAQQMAVVARPVAGAVAQTTQANFFGGWAWFLLGAWSVLVFLVVWSIWRRDYA